MQPQVVFFYGPPCSGKTLFYAHHFSQTHERISPQELFEADPSLSLRAVILKVVSVINKGQSVIVDDGKSTKKTRRSYLNILRHKVPHCACRVVHFHVSPSDGLFLCQWAREWELAHQFECMSLNAPCQEDHTAKDVEHWFEQTTEPPGEEEGFNEISKVEGQLICDTPFKFVVPALFLQWEGLFQEEDVQSTMNVQRIAVDVVKRWSHSNPDGRVIVLKLNDKQPCPNEKYECLDEMKQAISELVTQAAIPVFFVHLCTFLWKFHRPPNPGVFAWLQRLHSIDLSNRATLYVYSNENHQKAAGAAGIKCIKANILLHNPQMINAVHCGVTGHVPECVRKAKLAWFCSESRPAASVPLFSRAAASHVDMPPHCITVTNGLCIHGVCFKDLETFHSFNSRYQHIAVPTEPALKDIFIYKDCQSSEQDMNISERKLNAPSYLPSIEPRTAKVSPDKCHESNKVDQLTVTGRTSPSHLAKQLTQKDIESLAFSAGHFKRGEGCVKLIRNVTTTMEPDGVLFAAKCLGSQGQLYDVSALLSQKGVMRANCSCADPASKLGKCKHTVGLLLWCTNDKNMKDVNNPSRPLGKSNIGHVRETVTKTKEANWEVPACSNQEEVPSQLRKGKSLPKWMASLTQSTSSDGDGGKRTGDEVSPAKLRHKRVKTKKTVENTLYCLSPEELLQTAEEILEEYRCSLGDRESHLADQSKQLVKDKECRAKQSNFVGKQSCQGNSSSKQPAAPSEIGVLITETCNGEIPSNDSNVVSVVPETVAMVTLESHSNDNRLDLNEPSLRSVENRNNEQTDQTDRKEPKRVVVTSILDDFI